MSEWGPWIEHDGAGCPVPLGTVVDVVWEDYDGTVSNAEAGPCEGSPCWDWSYFGRLDPATGKLWARIIRYRVLRPRALDLLRDIAANPERELDDA